jgi:polyisoprenyl-teichoic acid--peptidoglycan teichoic acid transferase
VLVFVLSAIAGGVLVWGQIIHLRNALSQNKALTISPGALTPTAWGGPETLLLIGDDERAQTKYYHRAVPPLANEMLLVRLDPSKPYISMMSIPRELWVTIYPPDGVPYTNRLNSAYTFGIGTLVSTIKQVLGIEVNHVAVVTFAHFEQAVNDIGCVYSTVDQRYYHVNVPGGDQYQEIDLQPGYQNMCGSQALQFVSYRHTDTSLVRDARDQSFLLDVKRQYGPTLVDNIGEFEQVFGKLVQTDPGLHSYSGVTNLLGTLINSSSLRVRQVPFQATLLPTYDVATPQQIAASVHAFLYGGSPIPKKSTASVAHAVHSRAAAAHLPLVGVGQSELAQARSYAAGMPFPYEYPRVRDAGGGGVPVYFRDYMIHAENGSPYPAYVAAVPAGQLGQYYDVQGMTWLTAPQFADPDQTVKVAGRTYSLYYEGSNLKMVAWYERGAVYWIRNSLTDAIGNGELLAIAEQMYPLAGVAPASAPTGQARLKDAAIPQRTAATETSSVGQTLGLLGGLLALVALPVIAVLMYKRRRELVEVRGHLGAATSGEDRLDAAANACGLPLVSVPAARAAARTATGPRARPEDVADAVEAGPGSSPDHRRRAPLLAGVFAAVVAIVAGVYALEQGGGGAKHVAIRHHVAHPTVTAASVVPAGPLTGSVAVLNAGTTPGAAATMAQQLHAQGITIGTIGNLSESVSSSLEIAYAPGQQTQAERLARMLASKSPAVAPMDSATQAAAGAGTQLAVVIG